MSVGQVPVEEVLYVLGYDRVDWSDVDGGQPGLHR